LSGNSVNYTTNQKVSYNALIYRYTGLIGGTKLIILYVYTYTRMQVFSDLLSKYSENKEILHAVIQIMLIFYKIRPAVSIDSIKNTTITQLIPLVQSLKFFYIHRKDVRNKYSHLYVSSKPIPKNFLKSSKNFGKFLGYQCASNNISDKDIIKKGRIIYSIHEINNKIHLIADVCNYEDKKLFVKTLKHYVEFVEKSKDVLHVYNLKLKLEVVDEKTKAKTTIM
jgi:hypothetical protein